MTGCLTTQRDNLTSLNSNEPGNFIDLIRCVKTRRVSLDKALLRARRAGEAGALDPLLLLEERLSLRCQEFQHRVDILVGCDGI